LIINLFLEIGWDGLAVSYFSMRGKKGKGQRREVGGRRSEVGGRKAKGGNSKGGTYQDRKIGGRK